MRPLARKALEAIRAHGGRVINHDLIERTLLEIGREYKPGLLAWIRTDQNRWGRLLDLEDRINRATKSEDEGALTRALGEYRDFLSGMLKSYGDDCGDATMRLWQPGTLPFNGLRTHCRG